MELRALDVKKKVLDSNDSLGERFMADSEWNSEASRLWRISKVVRELVKDRVILGIWAGIWALSVCRATKYRTKSSINPLMTSRSRRTLPRVARSIDLG